jgi:hypothetical protein
MQQWQVLAAADSSCMHAFMPLGTPRNSSQKDMQGSVDACGAAVSFTAGICPAPQQHSPAYPVANLACTLSCLWAPQGTGRRKICRALLMHVGQLSHSLLAPCHLPRTTATRPCISRCHLPYLFPGMPRGMKACMQKLSAARGGNCCA